MKKFLSKHESLLSTVKFYAFWTFVPFFILGMILLDHKDDFSETATITTTVVECRNYSGKSHGLGVLGLTSAASGDYSSAMLYSTMANASNDSDCYEITVEINGKEHTVIRDVPYEPGSEIEVFKITTYTYNHDTRMARRIEYE